MGGRSFAFASWSSRVVILVAYEYDTMMFNVYAQKLTTDQLIGNFFTSSFMHTGNLSIASPTPYHYTAERMLSL